MASNLLSYLEHIPDPRRRAGSRHPLPAVLAMVVMGNLSGLYGYRELARFMQRHAWTFVRLFGFGHGVPNHVTISSILAKVDFESVKQQFEAWMQNQHLPVENYSLDGKSLKSTLKDYSKSYQDFVAMVQVFSHQSGLVHSLTAYHNGKQDEAQVVRDLIQRLQLTGAMLTLDALHCQKTLAVIVDSGNDYCVQVKGNQAKLLTLIKQEARQQKPINSHESRQKNRGRLEHRRVQLYKAPPHWQQTYAGICCFVVLRRWGLRKGKTYDKTHYYILSRSMTHAAQAGALIRSYWSVENRLHYVKDVTMGEDKNRIAHKQAAKNVSLLKNIALNLIRQRGYKCVKTAIDLHAHDIKTLFQWLL